MRWMCGRFAAGLLAAALAAAAGCGDSGSRSKPASGPNGKAPPDLELSPGAAGDPAKHKPPPKQDTDKPRVD